MSPPARICAISARPWPSVFWYSSRNHEASSSARVKSGSDEDGVAANDDEVARVGKGNVSGPVDPPRMEVGARNSEDDAGTRRSVPGDGGVPGGGENSRRRIRGGGWL